MSRLDQHVSAVRNKLAVEKFVSAVAWALLVFAGGCLLAILLDRVFQWSLPKTTWFFYGGLGAAALAAIVVAVMRRPDHHAAAVAIDHKLGLKEKFSTALSMRNQTNDPFVAAAVRDAEQTAQNVVVNFYQHFPLRFPRIGYATVLVGLLAFAAFFLKPMDLFGKTAKADEVRKQEAAVKQAEAQVKKALATVEAVPKAAADLEAVKQAKLDLNNLLKQPIKDPGAANRSALKALQDVNDAVKEKISKQAQFANAQNEAKLLQNLAPDPADKGPVADAQRALSNGEYAKAAEAMKKVAENFDKLDKTEQQKAIQQMQKAAQQLQQAAQNPAAQQQLQQQLQQLGANPQQAQQMAQAMQQAGQGNQQAQQQLQQMAQQMMQQMNNGQGPNQQQQQAINNALQQMQQQQGNQQAQQQMAQAMQQMAQAMQKAQQAQQQQQQGQNQQQQGQAGQQQQQMQQAMQNMQQQMDQMEAAAQDAQQLADMQQGLQEAMEEAAGQCNGGDGDGNGDGELAGRKDGAGQWGEGNAKDKGAGMGGAGIGAGGRAAKAQAPYDIKKEVSKSQDNKDGRLLASMLIKDNKPIKGSSTADLKEVAAAAEQEAADEVDTDRVGRGAQNVVKEYFGSLSKDQPAPADKPVEEPKKP